MRSKGPDPRPAQAPLDAGPDHDTASEDKQAKRQVFFVTFPHVQAEFSQCGVRLVSPESLSRAGILQRLRSACAAPLYAHQKSAQDGCAIALSQAAVFRELHKANAAGAVR